jgi:hypothetical protein
MGVYSPDWAVLVPAGEGAVWIAMRQHAAQCPSAIAPLHHRFVLNRLLVR